MKKSFEVQNLKCGGCSNTITKKLAALYSGVEVDVDTKQVAVEFDDGKEDEVKATLKELGYPVVGEQMGWLESTGAKAKSFVSCAVGRMDK
ncbi:MAG: heavy-metal-associated domain-containing protein [Campylobacterales bacterium]